MKKIKFRVVSSSLRGLPFPPVRNNRIGLNDYHYCYLVMAPYLCTHLSALLPHILVSLVLPRWTSLGPPQTSLQFTCRISTAPNPYPCSSFMQHFPPLSRNFYFLLGHSHPQTTFWYFFHVLLMPLPCWPNFFVSLFSKTTWRVVCARGLQFLALIFS